MSLLTKQTANAIRLLSQCSGAQHSALSKQHWPENPNPEYSTVRVY